ncbi:MAG: chemotaxis protein CheW, partial [Bdellovibrionia bacterium]
LDKTLLEAVKDPLTHIIRNACDHGIESPAERLKAGKKENGLISVRAYHEGGQVIVSVSDDGRGLDSEKIMAKAIERGLISTEKASKLDEREIFNFIFAPGFSTAAQISGISGRGVGMDVVKNNIERIGGSVALESEKGKGTTIRLKIPLTLAIIPAIIVRSQNDRYAIPQIKLLELVSIENGANGKTIEYLQGKPLYRLRGKLLPLLDLREVLGIPSQSETSLQTGTTNIVVLNGDKQIFGLIVDEILDTGDIVVKPLNRFLKSLAVYSGATILGDGSVALILDVLGLAQRELELLANKSADLEMGKSAVDARLKAEDSKDFILFHLNSPTQHALYLGHVHRLEEFKSELIEYSGQQRVIRYRNSALPITSLNEILGYPNSAKVDYKQNLIQVIVIQEGSVTFGLEVNEILDTLSTTLPIKSSLTNSRGISGNIVTEENVIVVIDFDYVISQVLKSNLPEISGQSTAALASRAHPIGNLSSNDIFSAHRKNFRVMFAEDTPFIRKHVVGLLERSGYQVTSVTNGEDALRLLKEDKENPYHIVISDIEMPKLNGFQLATQIRQDARLKDLPLIALTSRNDADFVKRGMQAGFTLYLDKGNSDNLVQFVDKITMNIRGQT